MDISRALRDMRVVAAEYMAHLGKRLSAATITHVAFLLLSMQLMSQALTTLLKHAHPFWSAARNASLDTVALLRTPPAALLRAATKRTDAAFWSSAEVLPWFWPLHLRLLLRGRVAARTKHPGTLLAFRLRVNTVGLIARRLSRLLHTALQHPKLQAHRRLCALSKRLFGFTRETFPRTTDEEDMDPHMLLAQDYHQHHFAGDVATMHADVAEKMQRVLARVGEEHGVDVRDAIAEAAAFAGVTSDQQFSGAPTAAAAAAPRADGDDGDDGLSAIAAAAATPSIMLTQLPTLCALNTELLCLRDAYDEEAKLDALAEANPHMTHVDIVKPRPEVLAAAAAG